ncbi:hypothetical protein CKG09_00115 [Lactobacillus helveticus]|nr:hypothetical protein [Lactobacillus helveticus]PAW07558.1 hypothetical protein CKG09_00115 [Lactobacillus helveticus]
MRKVRINLNEDLIKEYKAHIASWNRLAVEKRTNIVSQVITSDSAKSLVAKIEDDSQGRKLREYWHLEAVPTWSTRYYDDYKEGWEDYTLDDRYKDYLEDYVDAHPEADKANLKLVIVHVKRDTKSRDTMTLDDFIKLPISSFYPEI